MNQTKFHSDKCLEWPKGTDASGYGVTQFYKKRWTVHRLSFFYHTGFHPGQRHVLHKCHNRLCFNPKHLYLGDNNLNQRDRSNRVLLEKYCNNGHEWAKWGRIWGQKNPKRFSAMCDKLKKMNKKKKK